jgi:outer membrane protein assembly factor BamB
MRSPLTLAILLALSFPTIAQDNHNWPQFRGPNASGNATGPTVPDTWDLPTNKNTRWKSPIPGLAHSSPVIWQNKIFLTTADTPGVSQPLKTGLYGDIAPVNDNAPVDFRVLCLDKTTGKTLWDKTAHTGVPKIKRHPKATHANSTPAVDAKRVVAFFGAEGLYCYDHAGNLLWKRDLGPLDSGYFKAPAAQWGFASSPVLYQDKIIVQCDVQKGSFLAAFDATNGNELWRTPREEVPTWSTPTVLEIENAPTQIICNGWKQIAAYNLADGKLIWSLKGGGDIPVPTPIAAHGLVFITNAHGPRSPVYAINPASAKADITLPPDQPTSQHIPWSTQRGGNYMQTPIVVGDLLFLCRDDGTVTCYQAKTGQQLYRQRLTPDRKGFTASPIASADRIYYTAEDGTIHIIAATKEFKPLAQLPLNEETLATPALSNGTIYFRTRNHLPAIRNYGSPPRHGAIRG